MVFFLSSCCKPIVEISTLYNNSTNDEIELRVYNNGSFNTDYVKPKSLTNAFLASHQYGIFADSITVFVNGKYQQTHYAASFKKSSNEPQFVSFEDPKNLLNFVNYQKTIEELSCNSSRTKYIYNF